MINLFMIIHTRDSVLIHEFTTRLEIHKVYHFNCDVLNTFNILPRLRLFNYQETHRS